MRTGCVVSFGNGIRQVLNHLNQLFVGSSSTAFNVTIKVRLIAGLLSLTALVLMPAHLAQ